MFPEWSCYGLARGLRHACVPFEVVGREYKGSGHDNCSAAILIVAIGLSRLYLGVHYLSDVIGGYAAGVLWLSACITGFEISIRQQISQQFT